MTVTTPTINRIIKLTEFDLLRTTNTPGNMYMCTDSHKLYYDETKNSRVIYNYTGVKTVNDLQHNITPEYGIVYYCWEDNSLWLWMNKWLSLWTDNKYPSAYVYDENNQLQTITSNSNVIDNNGLLQDGSVVIRDKQRIIKGKIYINNANDNLVVSSYLGGGIRFLPNGKMDTDGELFVGDEGKSFIRSEMYIKDNEAFIDYSKTPEKDKSINKKDNHIYQIYHEGNIDPSALRVLTPEDIYNKLLDPSLNNKKPFKFDVSSISGKTINDISLVGHTHKSTDLTDFSDSVSKITDNEIDSMFNNAEGKGVSIDYQQTTNKLTISTVPFRLSLSNGVRGYADVNVLGDIDIPVVVDPNKHNHENYEQELKKLRVDIESIESIDPKNYYTTTQTDDLLYGVKATDIPTAGKPLNVNDLLILPGTSQETTKLNREITVNFTGDITGKLITDFSLDNYEVKLDSGNILSSVPVPGKALAVDKNNNLPGNAETASSLDHNIQLTLTNEASGTVIINTQKDNNSDITSVELITTLNPGDNILQDKDLGIRVPNLDGDLKIPEKFIPVGANGALTYSGSFNPNDGIYPSQNPKNNQYWVCELDGVLFDKTYHAGDWLVYQEDEWVHVSLYGSVKSVNGKYGDVTLTAQDINALDESLIDYGSSTTIPYGKIVTTQGEGLITGATVERLYEPYNILSNPNSLITIVNDGGNSTAGDTDAYINMSIPDTTYELIEQKSALILHNDDEQLTYRKNVQFTGGITANDDGQKVIVSLSTPPKSYSVIIGDGENTEFNIEHNMDSDNIIVQFRDETTKQQVIIDNTIIDSNNLLVTLTKPLPTNSIRVNIIAVS